MKVEALLQTGRIGRNNKEFIFYLFLAIAFACVPIFLKNQFYLNILIMILFWASMGAAWNLSGGYAGQFSFGHQCFFGIGAYTSTLLLVDHGVSPWLGILAGGIIAMLFATALTLLCFRLRGLFFALATLAFGELLTIFSVYYRDFTKGSEGIWIPFKPGLENLIFTGKIPYFYIFLILAIIMVITGILIERSRLGYYLWAIRENEEAAHSLGIKVRRAKLISMNLSAFFTAICGTLYAQYILFIDPYSVMTWTISVQMALLCMIGGIGTAFGPILGSFFITPLSEGLRAWLGSSYSGLHLALYGPILIWAVLYLPDGIWTKVRKIFVAKCEGEKGASRN